jgi:hypothetical protein
MKQTKNNGIDNGRAKLDWNKVQHIRQSNQSNGLLALRYGVNTESIRQARNGITWKNEQQ